MEAVRFLIPLALCCAMASPAAAYDRRYLPRSAAIAQADAIVVARAVRSPELSRMMQAGATAEVRVLRVLKGAVKPGPLTVALDPMHAHAVGALAREQVYLLYLSPAREGLRTILLDGTGVRNAEQVREVVSKVKRLPAWSEAQAGLSVVVAPVDFEVDVAGNVDLWIGYRNDTDAGLELKYRSWPLKTHTWWSLEIQRGEGARVAAKPHPHLTPKEIDDYFSRHGNTFDLKLAPGEVYFFPLQRINLAKPGWGYKERLDFYYYPMEVPGRYTITASGHHLLGPSGVVVARPVSIVITQGKATKRGKQTLADAVTRLNKQPASLGFSPAQLEQPHQQKGLRTRTPRDGPFEVKKPVPGSGSAGRGDYRMKWEMKVLKGPLELASLDRTFLEHAEKVLVCYQKAAQRTPSLEGKLVLRWRVGAEGRTHGAQTRSSSLRQPKMASCVLGLIHRWKFSPLKEESTTIELRLIFRHFG